MKDIWTEENIKKAAQMWDQGSSMGEIAKELGITRNSVSGKMSRNRSIFPKKGQPAREPVLIKKKAREYQKPSSVMRSVLGAPKTARFEEPELDEYEKERLPGVSLADNDGCMYPLTESSPHMFCGCNRVELGRYCEYHTIKCNSGITKDTIWFKKLVKGVK